MISVPGIGSGLDINSIVDGLVAAEGDAKTRLLATQRSDISSEVSAFGSLSSAVDLLRSASAALASSSTYNTYAVSSQDPEFFTASATEVQSAASEYDIEIRQLAEQQKLLSPAATDADTDVGSGTLTITVGADSFNVIIGSDNQTLTDIRDAINDAEDNTGVTASLLNVDDGGGNTVTKLVLTANETGAANAMTVTVADDDGNNTDASGLSVFYYDTLDGTSPEQMTEINEALDAELYIDNQRVLSTTNVVTDAIQGISINLNKAETGVINKLTTSADTGTVRNAIESFVSSYNTYIGQVNAFTDFNAETGVAGVLLGDATVRTLTNAVRTGISNTLPGLGNEFRNLVELGITTTESGALEIDQTVLNDAITSNLSDVETLFAAENGIATQLSSVLNEYTRNDGILQTKTEGLNESIDDIDNSLEALALSLETLEARLLAQFATLDQIVNQLNSTSSFLTQQFEQISQINQARSRR